jgi:hypothetical protein
MKIFMFRTVGLSIIRSLFTVHSAMVYVIQVCRQLSGRSGWNCRPILVLFESCLQTCITYTIAECTVTKLLLMDRPTVRNMKIFMTKLICEISASSWFITKKFVTMHGHMIVKFYKFFSAWKIIRIAWKIKRIMILLVTDIWFRLITDHWNLVEACYIYV